MWLTVQVEMKVKEQDQHVAACIEKDAQGYCTVNSRETGNVYLGAWQCECFDIFFLEIFAASGLLRG